MSARAALGHSPSARAVVNAGEEFEAICLSTPLAVPPSGPTLRDKVLKRVAQIVPGAARDNAGERELRPIRSSVEAVVELHIQSPDDRLRRQIVAQLGARGGVGEEENDGVLKAFLAQVAVFALHEVLAVSALDGEEMIHRVHRGFPKELGYMDVIRRVHSFCTHAVSADGPMVVENTMAEAFFRMNGAAQHMGVRSYLGVPIHTEHEGTRIAIGTLCGLSAKPVRMVNADVRLWELFAERAEAIVTKRGDIVTQDSSQNDSTTELPLNLYPQSWFASFAEAAIARPHPSYLAVAPGATATGLRSEDLVCRTNDELLAIVGSEARAHELRGVGFSVAEKQPSFVDLIGWIAACR
jgi:hypothetical protein